MDLSRAYQQGANLDLAALSACYRLQTLNVSNAASLTGLESLFRTAFPRLHTLTARDSAAVDDSLIRALCSRDSACVSSGVLKRLDFAGCNGLTDDGVCHVVEVLGDRLTTLKVGRCQSITDAAVSRIAEGCPRLVELDLEKIQGLTVATMFGKLILHRQSACRELTALSLSGVKLKEDGHQLAAFQTWAGDIASHASRPFHPGSPGEGRITLPVRAPRTTPKTSLKSLNVSGIPFLTAPVLNILLAHNPKLDVLRVSHCAGIAESSISHFREIAPACLNMRTLSLSRTPLPGTVLSKMLSPKLAVLDLSDNSIQARQLGTVLPHALTDATVAMICNNCPNLRAIHLARNGQLTDQTLFALMALYRTLRKVSLQRCRLMTAGNLRGFLNVCGRLEWLDLSEIPDICRWQELRELGSVKDRPQGAIDMEQDTSLILEGYTAMTKARALLNDMLLLFLAPVPSMPVGEDVLDDHPPSNPLSAWSSARTTPSKSSKSASINTSCCPSDAESGSEDGSERTADGLLRPAIRRSRRLRKIARNGQCYRHRNKYHALPDLPTAKGPAGRLRARAAANRTPLSERSGSTDSTPSDAGIGNLEATGDSAPIVAEQMPSPRRKELAHLFAALSSDAGYEE